MIVLDCILPGRATVLYLSVPLFLSAYCLLLWSRMLAKKRLLPPSPPGHWLWGNRDILSKPHLPAVLGTGYGDIMTLATPSETVVVLNNIDLAIGFLEKQSAITAGRPSSVMANELMGWGNTFTFTQHNQKHKKLRRLLGSALNNTAVQAYTAQQHENVAMLLQMIGENSADFLKHIHRSTVSLTMNVAYGYTVLENDPFLEVTRQAIHYLAVGTMTQFWVNWFPILKYLPSWLPGCEFKRIGERGRGYRESYMQIPFQAVTDTISQGHIVIPSFTSRVLAEKGGLGASAKDTNLVKISAAAFFLAGTTTTNAFIATFMLMMAVYPELAAEAQREIDALESQDRLPNLEDREALPYVDAFIQEVMRLSPPVPFGLAHETTEDVVHEGYHIPRGTTIRANIWALLHDPRAYAKPHTFDPKRYLKAAPDPDPRNFIFGFGRRSCPGVHLANNSTWLTCAGLLWAFEVSASHELVNRVAEIGGKNSPDFYKLFQPYGVSIEPLPFKCKINPRRHDFMKILRQFISL